MTGPKKAKIDSANNFEKNKKQDFEMGTITEGSGTINLDIMSRPNKFGLTNKTCDSFQPQRTSNASTANQTVQSNTIYSVKTTSSKRQGGCNGGGGLSNGIQSSQSPFGK